MGHPDKSYDEIQREAVLTACTRCPKWFYVTHPKAEAYVCLACRAQERA